MLKKFIIYLYNRYVAEPSAFEVQKKIMTKDEIESLAFKCRDMLMDGSLQKVIDMVVAESEMRQLYDESKNEKEKRQGIADLINKMKWFIGKLPKEKKEFDKFEF